MVSLFGQAYGLRLHFDSDALIGSNRLLDLGKMVYSYDRCKLDNPLDPRSKESMEVFTKLVTRKSLIWEYECEYRIIISPSYEFIRKYDLEYIQFNPKSLKKICLGQNYDGKSKDELLEIITTDPRYTHVKLFKAEFHDTKYKLNYKRLNP